MRVDEHTIQVAGSPIFYLRAQSAGTPILYLHGVPTSSDDWAQALALTGGIAPDLPGFGRSGKAGNLDYSIDGLVTFLEVLLDELELDRVALVAHDWGAAAGLAFAGRHPGRVQGAVLFNPLALVDGLRWRGLARVWRTRMLGELVMGSVNNRRLRRWLRRGSAQGQTWPRARADRIWDQFDQGTQRAILLLHRSAGDARVSAAAAALGDLTFPALVLFGERDPWQNAGLAESYAGALPHGRFELLPGAGHWPWLDQPELIERAQSFLASESP